MPIALPKHPLPFAQGAFFILSGLWPIIHIKSFEEITGPKVDRWLTKTLGGLITVVGSALVAGSFEEKQTPSLRSLGLGSALALGFSDSWYSLKGRISKVYLWDALVEAALVTAWAIEPSQQVRKTKGNKRPKAKKKRR